MRHGNETIGTGFNDSIEPANDPRKSIRRAILSPFLCSVLAALGIFGGISSLFAGLICVVIHSVISGDTVFDRVGTFLLIIAIPMILLGSVFLDEIIQKSR